MKKQEVDQIITQFLPKIYGFAVKKSFSYDEAEELSAEITVEAYTSLLRLDEISNLEGYIWRISEHVYSKYVASKKRKQGVSIDNVILPYYEDYSRLEAQEEIDKLRLEIAFLNKTRRLIIFNYYYKNRSIKSISAEMGIPEGTVKWHLNKARNELKEGYTMERKIGKLGLNPVKATSFGHNGYTGSDLGPETYLGDNLNLNIVYSVYHAPKTIREIAEELGITLVFIEERITYLEENGFLTRLGDGRYTTYVEFSPETYSIEELENELKIQLEIAETIADSYPAIVKDVISNINDVYIPDGNREVFEAACIFHGISKSCIHIEKDISHQIIKTTAGGSFLAYVHLEQSCSDPEYVPTLSNHTYWACGQMTRWSEKYPNVASASHDTRYCSRKNTWMNNNTSDYEYIYEYITGAITDNEANADKFRRLREKEFITEDGKVNIIIVKDKMWDFLNRIPAVPQSIIDKYSDKALEFATIAAKNFPPQMQDRIIDKTVHSFIGNTVALMTLDILYERGYFKPLTENERVTANLFMFSDILPNE